MSYEATTPDKGVSGTFHSGGPQDYDIREFKDVVFQDVVFDNNIVDIMLQ